MFACEVPYQSTRRVKLCVVVLSMIPLISLALVDFLGHEDVRYVNVLIHPKLLNQPYEVARMLQELRRRQPAVAGFQLTAGSIHFSAGKEVVIRSRHPLQPGNVVSLSEEAVSESTVCFSANAGSFAVAYVIVQRGCAVHEINHLRSNHLRSPALSLLAAVYSTQLVNALGDIYIDSKQALRDAVAPMSRSDVTQIFIIAEAIRRLAEGHSIVTIPESPDSPYQPRRKSPYGHPAYPNIAVRRRTMSPDSL